jgi:hypothetical protein
MHIRVAHAADKELRVWLVLCITLSLARRMYL